jgi:hypothetical protein
MFLLFLRSHGRLKPESADSKAIASIDLEAEVHIGPIPIQRLAVSWSHTSHLAGNKYVFAP